LGLQDKPTWAGVILIVLAGACPTALGGVFAAFYWSQLENRVFFCPGGFVNARPGGGEVVRWGSIEKGPQDYVNPERHNHGGPPLTRSPPSRVTRRDAKECALGPEPLRDHRQFARLMFAAAREHEISWEFSLPQ